MSFTPTPLPRKSSPEEISETTNINFALLQSTIKNLEASVRALKQGQRKKTAITTEINGKDLEKWIATR